MVITVIFINCYWVVTRWQWLFYIYTKYEIGLKNMKLVRQNMKLIRQNMKLVISHCLIRKRSKHCFCIRRRALMKTRQSSAETLRHCQLIQE